MTRGLSTNSALREDIELGPPQDVFPYKDAKGKVLFEIVRYDDGDSKTFKARQRDNGGGYVWNVKGVELVPYRLPELIQSSGEQPVWVKPILS